MNVAVEPIDRCSMCGSTPQLHLENPEGIKFLIPGTMKFEFLGENEDMIPSDFGYDYMICNDYMTRNGVTLSRNYLMMMLGDV